MAELLDWPLAAYSNWEAGKAKPRELVEVAKRIERLTGVPATWVIGLVETAPADTSGVQPATGRDGKAYEINCP